MTFSKTIICGRLVRDAEVVNTRNGQNTFTRFDLYTKEYAGKNAERRTEWWNNLQVWGAFKDFAATLKKGDLVYVECERETFRSNDESGQGKNTVFYRVRELRALSPKTQQDDSAAPANSRQQPRHYQSHDQPQSQDYDIARDFGGDDTPF